MKKDKTTKLGAPKEESPHHILEESDIMFNPGTQHLDLTREQKRRTTALMMAIQAYDSFIIKDAEMYMAISREKDRKPDSEPIRPATMDAIVRGAIQFDMFISGAFDKPPQLKPPKDVEATTDANPNAATPEA